jgi:hypothetical protein
LNRGHLFVCSFAVRAGGKRKKSETGPNAKSKWLLPGTSKKR